MTFDSDLRVGNVAEEIVLSYLRGAYPCATKVHGKWSEYDFWIPELHGSVEVKFDPKSLRTGNHIIEFYCNGKPSSLAVTTAFVWIVYDGIDLLFITPQAIRQCVRGNPTDVRVKKNMVVPPDPYPKDVYLIKKQSLRKYGIVRQLEGLKDAA